MRALLPIAALLLACGGPPPLPPAEPAPALAAEGDPQTGARLFADRALGRTGLACADCHPGGGGPRPAPDLARWAAGEGRWAGIERSPAESLAACVERFQARGPLAGQQGADLRAAIRRLPPPAPVADDPAALYGAACAHCHEDGPAGPLVGGRHAPKALADRLRRRPGPAEVMPRFDPSTLPDRALEGLVRWLAASATGSGRLSR